MAQAIPQTGQVSEGGVAEKRKVRLLRSSLTMVVVSVALIFVVLLLRDASRQNQQMAEFERCEEWLQIQWAELGRLPARLGTGQDTEAGFSPNLFFYLDDATRFYAAKTPDPVILVRSNPLHLWLTANGRTIIVKQGDQLRVEWILEPEYQQRQAEQDARVRAALNPTQETESASPER